MLAVEAWVTIRSLAARSRDFYLSFAVAIAPTGLVF